jgi:hypothetical protein
MSTISARSRAFLLACVGRHHRETPAVESFTRVFAIVRLTVMLGFMIVWLFHGSSNVQWSLPLPGPTS